MKTSEACHRVAEANRARLTGVRRKPEHVAGMIAYNTGRKHTPERRALQAARAKKQMQEKGLAILDADVAARAAAGATKANKQRAKNWHLRDPRGREWLFNNMNEFVLNHAALFQEGEAVWRKHKSGKKTIHAAVCLRMLYYTPKPPSVAPNSWHGWQIVSDAEVGKDLIARTETKQTL